MLSWLNSDLCLFFLFTFNFPVVSNWKGWFLIPLLKNDCTVFLVHNGWFGYTISHTLSLNTEWNHG